MMICGTGFVDYRNFVGRESSENHDIIFAHCEIDHWGLCNKGTFARKLTSSL